MYYGAIFVCYTYSYSWPVCLIGALSNFGVMFYVDWKFGLAALGIEVFIFAYLIYRAPENVWGDVAQSIIFHQVRKYLLRLDERKKHVKSWRPSILLLADSKYSALIDFCNNLKKGGLYIIGVAVNGEFGDFEVTTKLKQSWIDFIDSNSLKAFPQINVAPNVRNGLENLILLSGLGALQPNTVILPVIRIKSNKKKKQLEQINDNEKLQEMEEEKEEKVESQDVSNSEDNYNNNDDDKNGHNDKLEQNGHEEEDEEDQDEENKEIEEEEEREITRTTTHSFMNSNIISEYDMDGNLDKSKTIEALVPQSPADMDPDQYTKLCQNILKYDKNVIITANFHSFDTSLIVSDKLQQRNESIINMDKEQKERRRIKGREPSAFSVQSTNSDDAFLDKTINHDFIKNASVPKYREEAQWIDVWLFANDYTFNFMDIDNNCKDNIFPMLIMQLSHILLQNKVWIKKAKAKLRVLLMVDNKWEASDKRNFEMLLKQLRLTDSIDHLQILKQPENYKKVEWESIINGKKKSSNLKKYYNSLNSTIKSLSSETYFTFLKLPQFPPIIDNDEMSKKLNIAYYQSLYVLLRGLPPTALVATGEKDAVISTDL